MALLKHVVLLSTLFTLNHGSLPGNSGAFLGSGGLDGTFNSFSTNTALTVPSDSTGDFFELGGGIGQTLPTGTSFDTLGSTGTSFDAFGTSGATFGTVGSSFDGFGSTGSSFGAINPAGSTFDGFGSTGTSFGAINPVGSTFDGFGSTGTSFGDFGTDGSSFDAFGSTGTSFGAFGPTGTTFGTVGSAFDAFGSPGASLGALAPVATAITVAGSAIPAVAPVPGLPPLILGDSTGDVDSLVLPVPIPVPLGVPQPQTLLALEDSEEDGPVFSPLWWLLLLLLIPLLFQSQCPPCQRTMCGECVPRIQCPAGFSSTSIEGISTPVSCYFVGQGNLSPLQASARCRAMKGYLVNFDTDAEYMAVIRLLPANTRATLGYTNAFNAAANQGLSSIASGNLLPIADGMRPKGIVGQCNFATATRSMMTMVQFSTIQCTDIVNNAYICETDISKPQASCAM